MRHLFGLTIAAALWLVLTPDARAQVAVAYPAYPVSGVYAAPVSVGVPVGYTYAPAYTTRRAARRGVALAPVAGVATYSSAYAPPGTAVVSTSYYAPSVAYAPAVAAPVAYAPVAPVVVTPRRFGRWVRLPW
jgi:hypothetical protein